MSIFQRRSVRARASDVQPQPDGQPTTTEFDLRVVLGIEGPWSDGSSHEEAYVPEQLDISSMNSSPPHRAVTAPDVSGHLKGIDVTNLDDALSTLLAHPGVIGAAFVDAESGMALAASAASDIDIEQIAAVNSQAVRTSLRSMQALGVPGDLDDLLITFTTQYHVARLVPLGGSQAVIVYAVLDRNQASLAQARLKVATVANQVSF